MGGRVTWFFRAQVVRRFTYDREAGVYRVVEEYASKPRARGLGLRSAVIPVGVTRV